ncbi:MAG: dihydroorotase [Candidatus Endolissoclinum sp. TMED37]|nr:MAG: dihydroorotase [Candidatus Endolissoclinum sp. TMED37]|tara:strand:+ start:570 stop:1613 length:1044 start_codon:yes stop_codon:yes gene_type:complete
MEEIEIIKPDDWHVHFRDGEILKAVVPETTRHFARSIVMPNLIPPILNAKQAIEYKKRIEKAIPSTDDFQPLMTIYLTEETNKNELKQAYKNGIVFAVKLYPAGATTNSDSGVKDINKIMPILETMTEIGMPLLIHGEVTDANTDIFDREKIFIDEKLDFICKEFPELKITLEHITTKEATEYVKESNINLAASITPHHLSLNRNSLFTGGIRPHNFCLPILKREKHRKSLVNAAISGNTKFFLGTDTAPHLRGDKENDCGCAGVFNATYCMQILAEVFEQEGSIEMLEQFTSINGAKHYNYKINKDKIILKKLNYPEGLKKTLKFNGKEIEIFKPYFPVFWKVVND